MSRLGLGLGLTKGGLIPFNPLSLDPYLFFDSRSSMIGTLENPTLDLDPANPSTLDVITATRAGVATYTDADGLIQSASPNTTRVDYTQGAELTPTVFQLVPHTDFSTAHWAYLNGTVVTTDTTINPDGATAKKFSAGNGVSSSSVRSIISTPTTSNTYTLSWYAKAGGFDESMVRIDAGGSTIKGSVNLLTGAVTLQTGSALDSISSEAVSGGWFRISMTISLSGAGGSITTRFYPTYSNGYIGDGTSGVYLAMPQVEEGTTASDFVENTTGSPKFITGATYGPRVPMILVEPSSENLVDYSNLNPAGAWSSSGFSLTQNAIASPDGLNNGTKLEQTSTSRNFSGNFIISSTGTSVTYSFWVKKGSGDTHLNKFIIRNNNQSPYDVVGSINLESGEIIQNDFGTGNLIVEPYPNGWFKVKATRDTAISVGDNVRVYPPYTSSSGENEIGQYNYTFGHQLEYGTVATSFIPTSGGDAAARTRAADDLEITGSAFTDAFNASEGTFYVESVTNSDLSARYIFQASSSTGNPYSNRYAVYYSDHQNLQRGAVFATKDNVTQFSTLTASEFTVGTLTRSAFSYKTGDYRFSVDGAAELTPSGLKVPSPSINQIHLGAAHDGSVNLNGHLKRLLFWPTHSSRL